MSLEGSVHTPLGSAKKKELVIAGAGVLVVGIYLYRRRAAAAASTTSAGSGAAPSAATDPPTGYPYGSPEDTAALQASSLASYGYAGGGGGGGDVGGGGALSTPPTTTSAGGFSSNAQWAQAAESYLSGSTGGDANAISAALGKYLTGGYLTDAQVSIVQSAIAFEGYPPVAGQFGYPPSIHSGTPPGVVPLQHPPVDVAPAPVTYLHVINALPRTINFAWYSSAGGADHYEVYMDNREIGTTNNTNTYAGNLKPGSTHTFTVIAVSHGGKKSAPVSMTAKTPLK